MDPHPSKRVRHAPEGSEAGTPEEHRLVGGADSAGGSAATPSTTTTTSPLVQSQQPKEQRSVQACSRCRRLKSKCIRPAPGENPATSDICRGCKSAGVPCVFDTGPSTKRIRPSREPSAHPPPTPTPAASSSHTQQPPSTPQQQQFSSLPQSTPYSYSIPSGLPFSVAPVQASPPIALALPPQPHPSFHHHPGASYGLPDPTYQHLFGQAAPPPFASSSGGLEGRVSSLEGEMGRLRAQVEGMAGAATTYNFPAAGHATGGLPPASPSTSATGLGDRVVAQHHLQEFHLPQLPSTTGSTSYRHQDHQERRSLPPPTPEAYSELQSPRPTHTSDGTYGYQQSAMRRMSEAGLGPFTLSQRAMLGYSGVQSEDGGERSNEGRGDMSSDLIGRGVVDENTAKIALEFYISDLALHTPYITFMPSPVTDEHVQRTRASSSLAFDANVTITLRALDQARYDEGCRLVRAAAARLVLEPEAKMTTEDLRGLLPFSIWQADPSLTALTVQLAHTLNLHTALARYIALPDPFTSQGAALMDLARLYTSIYIHSNLLSILSSQPPLIPPSHTPSQLWSTALSRNAHPNGVDTYITSYLLFVDLLASIQTTLFPPSSHPTPLDLPARRRAHDLLLSWHTTQHAADSLITIVPFSFATVWVFSPLSYTTDSWSAILADPEGKRQVDEATEKALLLLELLLKTWRGRPMVRYTRDLHEGVMGVCLGHLVGRWRCCEDEGDGVREEVRRRLRGVLERWEEFGLETEGCLLGRILDELAQGEEGRGDAWEELRAKRWGREMWEAIVPSGRLRQEQ